MSFREMLVAIVSVLSALTFATVLTFQLSALNRGTNDLRRAKVEACRDIYPDNAELSLCLKNV